MPEKFDDQSAPELVIAVYVREVSSGVSTIRTEVNLDSSFGHRVHLIADVIHALAGREREQTLALLRGTSAFLHTYFTPPAGPAPGESVH